jgi:hypothetical protein
MKAFFGRRRQRSRTSSTFSHAESSFGTREASIMTTSSRTGGFEIPRESDYQAGDEDTILDASVYTDGQGSLRSHLQSTIVSTATTIKQSSSGRPKHRKKITSRPVLEAPELPPGTHPPFTTSTSFQAVAVVSPELSHTALVATARKPRRLERTSPSYSPESLKGLHLLASPDATETTEESTECISKIEPSSPSSGYRFEFSGMEEAPLRSSKSKGEDEEDNLSVHSFSFSENEDGTGFELDDPDPLVPGSCASEDRDDESSSSELSEAHSARVNISDSDLLDGRSSPGALRLTEEGLQRHLVKTFTHARHEPMNHADDFEAWRKEHETRKWHRQRIKEREAKLLDRSLRIQESQRTDSAVEKNEGQKPVKYSPFRTEDGVADLSLAPLNAMQHLSLEKNAGEPKKRSFRLFGKAEKKPRATDLLERERERAREAKRIKDVQARQEKDRIARKRKAFLERQRAKESFSGGALNRGDSVDTDPVTTSTLSSVSTATRSLPNCVICHENIRTHIATPCMHFSFCSECTEDLEASGKRDCPVCRQPNVTYSSVAV